MLYVILRLAMRTLILLTIATIMVASVGAQTNPPARFYVHFGVGYKDSAQRLLTTQISLGQRVFVAGGDHWQLQGDVKQNATGLVAELIGSTGPQSGSYK